MLASGDVDGLVTGLTRSFSVCFEQIARVIDPKPGRRTFGLSVLAMPGRTVFIADSTVNPRPSAELFVEIAIHSAKHARALGHEPRVALLSFSNFGQPPSEITRSIRDAVKLLDQRAVDFEYDGEMTVEMALDGELRQRLYPFCRMTGSANVLVMPGLHAADIGSKLLQKLGSGGMIGPLLVGLSKPVQIVQLGATVNDLVTAACLAVHADLQNERGL